MFCSKMRSCSRYSFEIVAQREIKPEDCLLVNKWKFYDLEDNVRRRDEQYRGLIAHKAGFIVTTKQLFEKVNKAGRIIHR